LQMKADMFYEGCQCFFVDIDYTKYESVEDYIGALTLKPIVVYMSYSDNVYKIDAKQKQNPKYNPKRGIKSRRFRLCYVFSEIIFGKENFRPKSGLIYDVRGAKTVTERNMKMKDIRWARYDTLYDISLSPRENAILFDCHEKTMRRFCKDRGIPTSNKVSDEYIRQNINLSLSIRGNINYFKEEEKMGLSKDRISRIKKELEFDIQRINKIVKDEKGWFIFAMNEDRSILKDHYPICNHINIDSYRKLCESINFCQKLLDAC